MRLLTVNMQVERGATPEPAWLVIASFLTSPGWVLFFNLPVVIRRSSYNVLTDCMQYGWHIPVIGFRHDRNDGWLLKIFCSWEFYKSVNRRWTHA